MASIVSLPSHSLSLHNTQFNEWSTTQQQPVSSQQEANLRKPKITIKFSEKNDNKSTDGDADHTNVQNQTVVVASDGTGHMKPWNLRSSKSRKYHDHASGTAPVQEQAQPSHDQSSRLGLGFVADKLKKRKQSISIGLSKQEIEDDIFVMTGLKPKRRPKKRPRNVQIELDQLFPGLHLKSITPDSYNVRT